VRVSLDGSPAFCVPASPHSFQNRWGGAPKGGRGDAAGTAGNVGQGL